MSYVFFVRRMHHIKTALAKNESIEPITVRELVGLLGSTRRGSKVVYIIRSHLKRNGLTTIPDFESVPLDAKIAFSLAPTESQNTKAIFPKSIEPPEHSIAHEVISEPLQEDTPAPELVSGAASEPAFRVSRLPAANSTPISVKPDQKLIEAITLMLRHDYSQLPVMTNERVVKGIISWETIGPKLALINEESIYIRDYMKAHHEINSSDSIFTAIPRIVEHSYVLVRDQNQCISGIITTTDLSLQFKQLSEPFLLLAEIENHVRTLIDGKFTKNELRSAVDQNDAERSIESVADLTFGEYIRLFQRPDLWIKTGIKVDRTIFTAELDKVRIIRNDVMHFDPDGISDEDHALLHHFVRFIHYVQTLTV